MKRSLFSRASVAALWLFFAADVYAVRTHVVGLGVAKKVQYSQAGDPAGYLPGEKELKIRPLIVDGQVKEWTTGDSHDVTDRSFAVRRVLRINDALPDESPRAQAEHWVWQKGPWLLIDRVTGRITPLHLPDYDPTVSQVVWFRDYAAYCGLTASGKLLYAVVAQVAARKPVLSKRLAEFDPASHPSPVCELAEWQRQPLEVAFHPTGGETAVFGVEGGSAVLVEEGEDNSGPAESNQ